MCYFCFDLNIKIVRQVAGIRKDPGAVAGPGSAWRFLFMEVCYVY